MHAAVRPLLSVRILLLVMAVLLVGYFASLAPAPGAQTGYRSR
jgi:hypothetical protein